MTKTVVIDGVLMNHDQYRHRCELHPRAVRELAGEQFHLARKLLADSFGDPTSLRNTVRARTSDDDGVIWKDAK